MAEEIKNKDCEVETEAVPDEESVCCKAQTVPAEESVNSKSEDTAQSVPDVKAENSKSEDGDRKCRGEGKKLKAEIESLKAQLAASEKKAEAQAAEAADKYTRLAAEYDNFRRRSKAEREAVYGDAVADTVMGIVPLIDNRMYADKFGGGDENPEKFAEGVKLILDKVPEILGKMNVTVFGEAGETFDPALHNAVMHIDDDSYGEGEITDVLQCGYKYGEKVIRYAMVKVAN